MSGVFANINRIIEEINNMVDLYGLSHLRVVYHVNPETGALTQEQVAEIINKIFVLNAEISKCDKAIGMIDVKTKPSSELTKARKAWNDKKEYLIEIKKKMEYVRNNELAILGIKTHI